MEIKVHELLEAIENARNEGINHLVYKLDLKNEEIDNLKKQLAIVTREDRYTQHELEQALLLARHTKDGIRADYKYNQSEIIELIHKNRSTQQP